MSTTFESEETPVIPEMESEQEVPEVNEEELAAEQEAEAKRLKHEEDEENKELNKHLLQIIKDVEDEERTYRDGQLQFLKKLDLFWHGIQRLYWSDSAKDYLTINDIEDPNIREEVEGLDEVVNIYRAHGESIIAALSTGIPNVRFFPKDADSALDILASKNHSRIAELLTRRIKAPLVFVRALFTLWNQHYVAAYHYSKKDKKFGEFDKTTFETQETEVPTSYCTNCGMEQRSPESMQCEQCGSDKLEQTTKKETQQVPKIERIPRSSQVVEIYGPVNVLIQSQARTIQDTGILNLYTENDVAKVYATYQDWAEKLNNNVSDDLGASERSTHNTDFPENHVTVTQSWIRPWMFWRLGPTNIDIIKKLTSKYPKGAYVVRIQEDIVETAEEDLDDRWTVSCSPVSRTIISDPMGQAVVSIQETVNDLYSFSKETVAHAIPETFYDSKLIDQNKYSSVTAKPGMLFPVNKQPGQSIQEAFFQFKPATLSREVDTFRARVDTDAQFVSGAFPSIYGGPNEGGSGTLGEYSMSKNMALQRLQISWKILISWWTELLSKITTDFAEKMEADEQFVKPNGNNTFTNVYIRKVELDSGKIGEIEPEASEQIPMSWAQKRDLMIQMLQLNNEQLSYALFHPENVSTLASLLGVPEFYVPGEEDRTKQLIEIARLLSSGPIAEGIPSVEIEPDVDNAPIHIEVIRAWANSEAGQETKFSNPNGYQNVLFHLRAHLQLEAQNAQDVAIQQQQQQEQQSSNSKNESPKKTMNTPETTPEPLSQ